jgi:hypothetical protein
MTIVDQQQQQLQHSNNDDKTSHASETATIKLGHYSKDCHCGETASKDGASAVDCVSQCDRVTGDR